MRTTWPVVVLLLALAGRAEALPRLQLLPQRLTLGEGRPLPALASSEEAEGGEERRSSEGASRSLIAGVIGGVVGFGLGHGFAGSYRGVLTWAGIDAGTLLLIAVVVTVTNIYLGAVFALAFVGERVLQGLDAYRFADGQGSWLPGVVLAPPEPGGRREWAERLPSVPLAQLGFGR